MKPKISTTTTVLMVSVASIIDLIQMGIDLLHFIPVIGNAVAAITTALLSVVAWVTFYIWMKIKGISFVSPKRSLTLGGGFLLELIPILNALPAWTLAVVLILGSTKAEQVIEKTTGTKINLTSGRSPLPNIEKPPLNK